MKYLKQFLIIAAFSFVGEVLHTYIPLPVPASIYGIVLLFAALCLGIIKVSAIKETSDFLIEIMPVMFVPACVGVMDTWADVKSSWVSYLVILVVTTVAVMAVSGLVTQAIIRRGGRKSC